MCLVHKFLWFVNVSWSFVYGHLWHMHIAIKHTWGGIFSLYFRSDFVISSWILVVCCLQLVYFQPPTQACPFYPAALSPSVVTCVRYSAVTKHFCSHWYTQFEFLNSSYKLVCESKHCALRIQVTVIIHNFNKMVPGRSSEQRVKYILLICKKKKIYSCFPKSVMIVSPYVTDDKSLTFVHSGIFFPKITMPKP